ncbi:hypothetical protein [Legionella sainthelensi]|nr:hypothetical protein [Legionella sainthelensi]
MATLFDAIKNFEIKWSYGITSREKAYFFRKPVSSNKLTCYFIAGKSSG